MNKFFLITVGIFLTVGLIAIVFWLSNSNKQSPTDATPDATLPIANPAGSNIFPAGSNQRMSISSSTVSNFITNPMTVKDPINPGYYYLGYHVSEGFPDPTATDAPPYVIEYIDVTQHFNIALLQEPIGSIREEMQQFLMPYIGLSQNQMCQLDYMVSVPNHVNSQFSGINLGFSFCPDAVVLPK